MERRTPVRHEAEYAAGQHAEPEFGAPSHGQPLRSEGGWHIQSLLEQTGVLPVYAHRVLEEVRDAHNDTAPRSIAQEVAWACDSLRSHWMSASRVSSQVHIFVGPPGSGKTTCLSKWLAQTVLVEGRAAVVFRLDAHVANTAESLTVLCEILGARAERFAPSPDWQPGNQAVFIDLPGVNPNDADAVASLEQQISGLPQGELHLVLNAAYDTPLLLTQARAFSGLPVSDVVAAHLDEERRWGRLWNLVLGSGYPLRFLSAGQNIPGEFLPASAEAILGRQFPQHRAIHHPTTQLNPRGKSSAQLHLT